MGSNKGNIPDEGVIWESLIIIIGCRPTLPILIKGNISTRQRREGFVVMMNAKSGVRPSSANLN